MAKKIKVRMMTSIAGNAEPTYELDDFAFQPGQEVDLHPALAKAWIEGGHAVLVVERERESTAIKPPETAVLPDARVQAQAAVLPESKLRKIKP